MKKKFLYILTLAALVCSCVKEGPLPAPASPCDEIGVERDGKVTLGFNVDLGDGMGEGTKALGETPTIQNIYVAVFDATGYKLSEYVKADPITTGPENDHKYQFTIQLKVSDSRRTLHFIANGPEELRFGTEQEVIGELYSMYNADESDEYHRKDAYWQRLVFEKISPRPEGTDDGSQAWQDYNTMVETLSNLKLIRNFSKVTLSKDSTVDNFVIEGMWFVNYPDRGSIAPYNRNTGKFGTDLSNGRTKNYLDYDNMAGVEDPDQGNYQGFTLASTNFITPETFDNSNMIAAIDGTVSGYVYEREKALTSPLYIIVKGRYDGSSSSSYYKIAMQDKDGNFYAMLRNFNYNVKILGVSSAGYSSAAAALAGVPTGDLSMNIDFKDLPNISDGDARLTVSATKFFIIPSSGNKGSVEILYKYEPDIANHANTGLGNEWVIEDPENEIKDRPYVTITRDASGSAGDVIESMAYEYCYYDKGDSKYKKAVVNSLGVKTTTVITESDFDSYGHITINSTEAGATPKTQTVTITGKKWGTDNRYHTITRTVQLVLRDALEMSVSASPNTGTYTDTEDPEHPTYDAAYVLAQTGQAVQVHIGIEQDLPSSMFPLYLRVSPRIKSLTPDNDYASVQELPVRYGTDATGHPSYWFEKAVSWTEYEGAPIVDGKKQINVYFKTILAANATKIDITNDYFAPGTAMVENYTPQTFSSLAFGGSTHKVAQPETFSYTMSALPADGKVNIAMKGIEPALLTGFTFLGKDSDGFWIYEREVSNTSDSFNIVPYLQGTAEIKLSAHLFTDATASVSVVDPDAKIYVNADGAGLGANLIAFTSTNVNSGKLVVGQKVSLTFYVLSSAASSTDAVTVTDYAGTSKTASRSTTGTSGTVTIGENTFNRYTVSDYTVPVDAGGVSKGYDNLFRVYVNSSVIGSFFIPVYGIELGTKLTSVSFDTNEYYVIQYASSNRYLFNDETNSSQAILKDASSGPDFSCLWQFGNSSSPCTIKAVKITSGDYYLNMNRSGYPYTYTPRLNTSSSNWSFAYNTNGFTIKDNSYSRYVYGNNGNIAQSNSNSNYYWNIYPVTFVEP